MLRNCPANAPIVCATPRLNCGIIEHPRQAERVAGRERAGRGLRPVVIFLHPDEDGIILHPRGIISAARGVQEQFIELALQLRRPSQPCDLPRCLVKIERAPGHRGVIVRETFGPARAFAVTPQQPTVAAHLATHKFRRLSRGVDIRVLAKGPFRRVRMRKSSGHSRKRESCHRGAGAGGSRDVQAALPGIARASPAFPVRSFGRISPASASVRRRINVFSPPSSPCGSLPGGEFPSASTP